MRTVRYDPELMEWPEPHSFAEARRQDDETDPEVKLASQVEWFEKHGDPSRPNYRLLHPPKGERRLAGYVLKLLADNPKEPDEEDFVYQSRVCSLLPRGYKHRALALIRERYNPALPAAREAKEWRQRHGLPEPKVDWANVQADLDKAQAVAEAYAKLRNRPDDPRVKAAYEEFKAQNEEMWQVLVSPESEGGMGLTVEFVDEKEPYASAEEQRNDVDQNRRIKVSNDLGAGHPLMTTDEYNRFRACFSAGTLVRTRDGHTPIEAVKAGQEVLSADGSWNRVRCVMERPYVGEMLDITTNASFGPISVTPEHPFWVLRGNHYASRTAPCTPYVCARSYGGQPLDPDRNHEFVWAEADALTVGTWFPLTVDRNTVDMDEVTVPTLGMRRRMSDNSLVARGPGSFRLSPEFLWVVGFYIAEGCVPPTTGGPTTVAFALHRDEVEFRLRLIAFAEEHGWSYASEPHREGGWSVRIYSAILARWWPEWLGKGANNKQIPPELLRLPPAKLSHLIQGIFDGDGRKGRGDVPQTSLTLALQLMEAAARLGCQPTTQVSWDGDPKHHEVYDVHELLGARHGFRQKKYTWRILGADCRKVTSVARRHFEGTVYNLSVENHETYVVQNLPVHNCHDVFGHVAIGSGFDRHGEYAAWLHHNSMYTGEARRAMSTEYHGSNSAAWNGGTPRAVADLLPDELTENTFDDKGNWVRKDISEDELDAELRILIDALGLDGKFANRFDNAYDQTGSNHIAAMSVEVNAPEVKLAAQSKWLEQLEAKAITPDSFGDSRARAAARSIVALERRLWNQLAIYLARQRRDVLDWIRSGVYEFDRPRWDRELAIVLASELRSGEMGAESEAARRALLKLILVGLELNAITEAAVEDAVTKAESTTAAQLEAVASSARAAARIVVVNLADAMTALRPHWSDRNEEDANWLLGLVGFASRAAGTGFATVHEVRLRLGQWANRMAKPQVLPIGTVPGIVEGTEEAFNNADRIVGPRIALSLASAARHEEELLRHQRAGVASTKIWFSARDERVRPSHRGTHGEVRALHEPFLVGASLMQYPHDPVGELEERINCRCVLLFQTEFSKPLTDAEALMRAEAEARTHSAIDRGVG